MIPRSRRILAWLLLAAALAAGISLSARRREISERTHDGRRAVIEGRIFLRVPIPRGKGLEWVARRFTGTTRSLYRLKRYNPTRRRRRLVEARVPLDLLLPSYRLETLSALFPKDRWVVDGWEHVWQKGEKWTEVARWFTSSSRNAYNLEAANREAGRRPRPGTRVLIPHGLLLDCIRALRPHPRRREPRREKPPARVKPMKPAPEPAAAPTGDNLAKERAVLSYGRDDEGPYAIYHLKAGEALYSSVVVRFTGNVTAHDVNELALRIAKRSGIQDVTDIPVGFSIKIPLDVLLPQFLPDSDPRYQAWVKNQEQVGKYRNTYKSSALAGVVVILDPGHGGFDRGAMANGVWEDSYVYDIACRIHQELERRTKARVLITRLDPKLGYRPVDKWHLTPNIDSVLVTHPWFHLTSPADLKPEVNLRWYLANYYFHRITEQGIDPQRVVFTSIHADSLHPSLRGTMFYIPGNEYRHTRWKSHGSFYRKFMEYRVHPTYRLTKKELTRSEGLSLQFSKDLEASFRKHDLLLHTYEPIRDHVIRRGRSWVPAVLRNSIIPCSILIEVCNINNRKDARKLEDPAFRQDIADAYVDALIRYYS